MSKFTDPLDNVRIASPCPAKWEEMHGDVRIRFCAECKLNVYNLSAMTKAEAENLLINSEGRLCVQIYRRSDGTVLTRDCPVGWARIRQHVSKIAVAAFSMLLGFFSGVSSFNFSKAIEAIDFEKLSPRPIFQTGKPTGGPSFGGVMSNLNDINNDILKKQKSKQSSSI